MLAAVAPEAAKHPLTDSPVEHHSGASVLRAIIGERLRHRYWRGWVSNHGGSGLGRFTGWRPPKQPRRGSAVLGDAQSRRPGSLGSPIPHPDPTPTDIHPSEQMIPVA